MGWIGWTEVEALDMTPQAIRLAKKGRVDMINNVMKAAFGKGDGKHHETLGGNLPATAANLKMAFEAMRKGGGL